MSSFFGVDFFRVVNEGLVDDWAQVYAKVPFEEDELISKGALFGVLRIKGGKKLVNKGSDIFLWLDEYFNQTKEKGDLRGLIEGLLKKNGELQAAWAWIVVDKETGERVVKSAAMNGGKVVIARDGQEVVLADRGMGERVVVGSLKAGDKLGLGVGGMVDRLGGLGNKKRLEEVVADLNEHFLEETERAVAGLLLEVKKGSEEAVARFQRQDVSVAPKVTLLDESETSKPESLDGQVTEQEEVVSENRVVGPEGLKKKMVGYFLKNFKRNKRIEIREEKGNKSRVLWLGVVFLVLFVMSVAGGVVKSKREKVRTSWQSELSSWQKREDEAKSLVQINPVGARKLLMEVKKEVAEAEGVWVGTKYEKDWMEYKLELEKSWTEVSGEKRVEPKLFLGLNLIRSGLVGSRVVGLGEGVGVLDLESGLMVKIGLEDKKAEVVASDKEKKWKAVGGDEKREVFLTSDGLSLADGKNGVEFDAAVVDPIEVEVFGSGAYVLDAGAGEVWRFGLSGDSISDRRRWLEPDQEIGIGELVDMDIDGDIWVLGKKGEVSKLRRGNRERFSLEGKPENLVGDRIAVQPDGEKIAILDISGARVVIFNKESGEYLHQLIWDGFSKAKDVLYVEDGRMMVLSENKLYWVE